MVIGEDPIPVFGTRALTHAVARCPKKKGHARGVAPEWQ